MLRFAERNYPVPAEACCKTNALPARVQVLQALCRVTERDVRSCLNTLQLLARQHAHIQVHHVMPYHKPIDAAKPVPAGWAMLHDALLGMLSVANLHEC